MLQSLLHLIGIDAAEGGRISLHWHHPAWLVTGLVLLPIATWFIVRRHRAGLPQLSPGTRRVLTGCRVFVLLLLVIVLGGPYAQMEDAGAGKAVVVVLIDESASMSLGAGAARTTPPTSGDRKAENGREELSRAEALARAIHEHRETLFAPIMEMYDVRAYRFAQSARAVDIMENALTDATSATSPESMSESSIGGAMERALQDAAGRPIAAIVLFSDGRWTIGPDPVAMAQPSDGRRTTPVFTVPVGSGDVLPDVALLEVMSPRTVAKDDVASITATVGGSGFNGKAATVRLLDGDRELDKAMVTLRDGEPQVARLTFRDTAEPGARLLRVAVEAAEGERVKGNNEQTIALRVDGAKLRVLYLESAPRWDYRFLDHALRRDKGIDMTVVMESHLLASQVSAAGLPAAAKLPEDAAGFAAYSLVFLGDVSPDLLPAAVQEALAEAVREKGVGLIVQAGTQSMPGRFAGGTLGDLLPVKCSLIAAPVRPGGDDAMLSGIEAEPFAPFRMRVTAAGAGHPAFQIHDSASRSRAAWSAMPDFYWAAAVTETAPGATVLAEIGAGAKTVPLIAEHFAGRGRVMFVGTDSTYLWRRNVGDALFYRFWGQAIRHVAMKPERRSGAWIEVTPDRTEPGEMVVIEMVLGDDTSESGAAVEVMVAREGGEAEAQALTQTGQAGVYRGSFVAGRAGRYRISFERGKERVSAGFFAVASGREFLRPDVDRRFMSELAEVTGGRIVELDKLQKLAAMLPRPVVEPVRPREVDVWDQWITLVLIVGFYAVDVGVRRMAGVA